MEQQEGGKEEREKLAKHVGDMAGRSKGAEARQSIGALSDSLNTPTFHRISMTFLNCVWHSNVISQFH